MSKNNEIKFSIDGVEITAKPEQSILQAARAHGIFIPAICYLSCTSPTLACRMCMVEADGKRLYACNAKPKEGSKVLSDSAELRAERRAIMESYVVNHPLQCGVCDKSGECELQNLVHLYGVDSQNLSLAQSPSVRNSWGNVEYDSSLCILCERCVSLCKDKIGAAHLKNTKLENAALPDNSYKDLMPKDAFMVWNRAKKGIIAPANDYDCGECSECAAVCPVGALSEKHFKYSTNAWELEKSPSACNFCSLDCSIILEHKQAQISGGERIYRISTDSEFATLCHHARLGFLEDKSKNKAQKQNTKDDFNRAIAALKEARQIKFSANISNEESLILQNLKQKLGVKLICPQITDFAHFVGNFAKNANDLWNAKSEDIKNAELIGVCGFMPDQFAPVLAHWLNMAKKQKKANVEIDSIESSGENKATSSNFAAFLENFTKSLQSEENKDKSAALIVGGEVFSAENAAQIAQNLAQIQKEKIAKIFILPPFANALGIALICDISITNTEESGFCIGYYEKGDFEISDKSNADIIAPTHSAKSGTLTNAECKVVPFCAALSHNGYELSDFAQVLINQEAQIDLTQKLPVNAGFKAIEFENLHYGFDNSGIEVRGYELVGSLSAAILAEKYAEKHAKQASSAISSKQDSIKNALKN